jgi:hypothetical protein
MPAGPDLLFCEIRCTVKRSRIYLTNALSPLENQAKILVQVLDPRIVLNQKKKLKSIGWETNSDVLLLLVQQQVHTPASIQELRLPQVHEPAAATGGDGGGEAILCLGN